MIDKAYESESSKNCTFCGHMCRDSIECQATQIEQLERDNDLFADAFSEIKACVDNWGGESIAVEDKSVIKCDQKRIESIVEHVVQEIAKRGAKE